MEDWITLAVFWLMVGLRLPAVLHPLCAEQQPGLDRGDRDQLPESSSFSSARPCACACRGTSMSTCSITIYRRRVARTLSLLSMSSASSSSLTPSWLCGATCRSLRDERMTTVNLPRKLVLLRCVRRLRADVPALRPGLVQNLSPRLFRARTSRRIRHSGSLTMLLLVGGFSCPDADRRAGRRLHGGGFGRSICSSTMWRPTSSPRSA